MSGVARSKSKHRRVQMKIKQAWKKRAKNKKAAAKAAGTKKK
jgi:hypothetical protein